MTSSHEPKAIRREDYRPSDYRIDTVDLEFDLDPQTTRVKARLALHATYDVKSGARPLVLDGDELELVSLSLDGKKLAKGDYTLDDKSLTIPAPPKSFTLEIETAIHPAANTKLSGLYVSSNVFCTQCEAEGFRRITYFLDRPDVMATYRTTIRAARAAYPVLLSNGNLAEQGELKDGRHFAVWHDPFPKPSYLFALVAGDLAKNEDSFVTRSGRKVALAHLRRARQGGAHRLCHGCAQALDALGRGALRPRIRSRPVQHRRRQRFQHGRDGEQEPQRLQRQIHPRRFPDRDRQRLCRDRDRRRARVFPQLDGRSHHLPRLVPAQPQGRADGIPRPGIFLRHALAPRQAHPRRAHPARAPVPRGCRPARAQCAAGLVYRDQQFLHADRLREGLGSHPHDAHDPGRGGIPEGHGALCEAP